MTMVESTAATIALTPQIVFIWYYICTLVGCLVDNGNRNCSLCACDNSYPCACNLTVFLVVTNYGVTS